MARDGIEPSTFRFSVGRSYQLSYLAGTQKVIRISVAPLAKTSDFLIGREHDEVTNCYVAWCLEHVHKCIRDVFRAHSPTGCNFLIDRCVTVRHPPEFVEHDPGRDCPKANSRTDELLPCSVSKRLDGVLCSGIDGLPGNYLVSGDRTCDNDVAGSFVDHVGEDSVDEVHDTKNIRTSNHVYAF